MRKNKFGEQLKEFLEFSNISINDFAFRVDSTSKNIIDIINGNIELSQNMIYNISFITDIPVSYIENVESNYKLDKKINIYLKNNNLTIKKYINKFKYKEAFKLYNIKYTNEKNDYSIAKDILRYLRISTPESLENKDNTIFYKSKNDNKELLALWLERCYKLCVNQMVANYNKESIELLVNYIKEVAKKNEFKESNLIKEFNKYGIYLVIEDDIPGSKTRGAFKVLNNKPAIYLTRKYKRVADIYFALLHELAHCKSDFNRAKSGSIVSTYSDEKLLDYEIKADNTAYNWMIEDKEYSKIKSNLSLIKKSNHSKAFVVYRLAVDKIISYNSELYQKYNPIIDTLQDNSKKV